MVLCEEHTDARLVALGLWIEFHLDAECEQSIGLATTNERLSVGPGVVAVVTCEVEL